MARKTPVPIESAPVALPSGGGSYRQEPATGELIRVEATEGDSLRRKGIETAGDDPAADPAGPAVAAQPSPQE